MNCANDVISDNISLNPSDYQMFGIQIRWLDGFIKSIDFDGTNQLTKEDFVKVLKNYNTNIETVMKISFYFNSKIDSRLKMMVVQYRISTGWNNWNPIDDRLFEVLKNECEKVFI
jgi:hypothetical protein